MHQSNPLPCIQVVAFITCLLQLSLIALLATDCVETLRGWIDGDLAPFVLWEAIPVTAAVAFYFSLLMHCQWANSCDFYSIFRSNQHDRSISWRRSYLRGIPFGWCARWAGILVNQVTAFAANLPCSFR